jgi:hypothetical protein
LAGSSDQPVHLDLQPLDAPLPHSLKADLEEEADEQTAFLSQAETDMSHIIKQERHILLVLNEICH